MLLPLALVEDFLVIKLLVMHRTLRLRPAVLMVLVVLVVALLLLVQPLLLLLVVATVVMVRLVQQLLLLLLLILPGLKVVLRLLPWPCPWTIPRNEG
jgi:hypothetical protein